LTVRYDEIGRMEVYSRCSVPASGNGDRIRGHDFLA